MEFKPWPKITRWEKRRIPVFTEKIDGTNACIVISEEGDFFLPISDSVYHTGKR